MRLAMTSRVSHSLLVAALAFLVLPSYGTAQAPRRPAQADTPYRAATRALNEGRYDDVDAIADKLDPRSERRGGQGARRDRARTLRGGRGAAASGRRARAVERGGARARPAAADARPARRDGAAREGGAARRHQRRSGRGRARRRARCARSAGSRKPTPPIATQPAPRPTMPPIQTAFGRSVPREVRQGRSAEVVPDGAAGRRRAGRRRWSARRARSPTTTRRRRSTLAKRALEVNPSSVDAQIFLAGEATDAEQARRGAAGARQGAGGQPVEPRGDRAARGALVRRGQAAGVRGRSGQGARDRAALRRGLPRRRRAGGAQLPLRRGGRADAPRAWRSTPATRTRRPTSASHLLRTGDEAGARVALEASFKADPFNKLTKNQLDMMDKVDKFVTVRDGDVVMRLDKDEAPVLREYAMALAHQALSTLAARYEFTPRGPILIEIFPEARRLRGPHARPARHDRRARRLLRPRRRRWTRRKARPPGEFQWEATLWHELAHVITLQMSNQRVPRWLTEGISVYEEKKARAEWGREMDVAFAGMLNRGETLKLRDLNSAFTEPEDDLARVLRGLAAGRAHRQRLRRRRAAQAGAGLRAGHRHRRGAEGGAQHRSRSDAGRLRSDDRADVRHDAPRAGGARGRRRAAEDAGAGAEDDRRRQPAQLPGADGARHARCARRDRSTRRCRRSSAPRRWCRPPAAPDSPHEQMAAIALEKKDRARAIAELTALVAVDFNNVEAARQLAELLRQSGVEDPAKLHAGLSADRRDRSVRRRSAHDARPLRAAAQRGRRGVARVPRRPRARPGRPAAAYTDLAESYFKGGKRAEAKKQTLAALEIAPSYERAQDLLLKLVDDDGRSADSGSDDACGGRIAVVALLLALFTLMPALQPRVDAQLPGGARRSLRRPAVALRPHEVPPQVRERPRPAGFLRRAVGHRRAGGRAEPVAPHQDRDRDPGRGSDSPDARRPRLFEYPWIYFVEPSSMRLQPTRGADPPRVLRCAAASPMIDDFHGPAEWADFEQRDEAAVSRSRRSSRCRRTIRSSAASTSWTAIPQVAGLGSFLAGRTWERGGVTQHLRTILDDTGRPMMFINWNTDMGDGWEWSNAQDYPGYIKYTALAYRMGINEIVYALTH